MSLPTDFVRPTPRPAVKRGTCHLCVVPLGPRLWSTNASKQAPRSGVREAASTSGADGNARGTFAGTKMARDHDAVVVRCSFKEPSVLADWCR